MNNIEVLTLAEVPQSTNTYCAIPNIDLHNLAVQKIEERGLTIVDTRFKSNRAGTQVIGLYSIDCGDPIFNGMLGWRNSYDKTRSVAVTVGSCVGICENGGVMGELQFLHKHNSKVDRLLEGVFEDQLDQLDDMIKLSLKLFEEFSVRDITEWFRNATIGNLFMKDYISTYQLSEIKRQCGNPAFDYGYPGTLWEFFNHCTLALKTTQPRSFFEAHTNLRKYFEQI